MPTISSASKKVDKYPSRFAFPYGNESDIPVYSSIPTQVGTRCIPCAVCVTNTLVSEFLQSQQQYSDLINGGQKNNEDKTSKVVLTEY